MLIMGNVPPGDNTKLQRSRRAITPGSLAALGIKPPARAAFLVYCFSWTQANPPQDAHLYRRKLLPLRVSSREMAAADPLHWEQVRKGGSIRCAFFPAFSSSLMTGSPMGSLLTTI